MNLTTYILPNGEVTPDALPQLKELVDRYPYYHAARMLLLRLLYQQRDPQFNDELRRAALYLPSRAKIYEEIEGDSMRPRQRAENTFTGATHRRKSQEPIEHKLPPKSDRTGELLDVFLNGTPSVLLDTRSGRPVDATTDYMAYLLQEEANNQSAASGTPADRGLEDDVPDRIADFISKQGDKRIQLTEKPDTELQRPQLADAENGAQQGAFTETLARIYIKQGKFEQAIKIIRQLSLKYPKKNRYFADQIRFLEKLILNDRAKTK